MTPYLLVGIDTEGDNQWDLQSPASTRPSRTSTRCRSCTRCSSDTACGPPTSSPGRWPATSGRSRCCASCCCAATVRSARTITRGRPRRAAPRTSGRHPLRVDAGLDQFEAQLAQLTAAIARAVGRAAGLVSVRAIRVRRLRTSPRSSATAISSSRASSRCSTSRTRAAPTSSKRRCAPYFLAYDSAVRPGTSRVLEIPCSVGAPSRRAARLWRVPRRARRGRTRRERVLRKLGIARLDWLRPSYSSFDADVRAGAPADDRRRPCAEHALPLERSDRRRQSVQPDRRPSWTRSSIGSIGSSQFAVERAGRAARDVPRVPRELRRRPCGGGRSVPAD